MVLPDVRRVRAVSGSAYGSTNLCTECLKGILTEAIESDDWSEAAATVKSLDGFIESLRRELRLRDRLSKEISMPTGGMS